MPWARAGDHLTQDSTRRKLRLENNPEYLWVKWLEGLEPLPWSHGPDAPSWDNSVALCATMKDENITDIREWLTYYQCASPPHAAGSTIGSILHLRSHPL